MKEILKNLQQLRADIDLLIVLAGQLRSSRQVSLAFTKIEEARMHVGNALFELKGFTPYKDSTNPANNHIDPYYVDPDVVKPQTPEDWNSGTLIENIKIMRRELELIGDRAKKVNPFKTLELGQDDFEAKAYAYVWVCQGFIRLREAFNWYGMELGRIRDEQIG